MKRTATDALRNVHKRVWKALFAKLRERPAWPAADRQRRCGAVCLGRMMNTSTDALILSHRRIAWAVAWRWHQRSGGHAPLDELRADAELGLVKAGRGWRPSITGASFATWAWRCCQNELKSRWIALRFLKNATPQLSQVQEDCKVEVLCHRVPGPERAAELADQVAAVRGCVTAQEWHVLHGVWMLGQTHYEVAQELGVSTSRAYAIGQRALGRLRRRFGVAATAAETERKELAVSLLARGEAPRAIAERTGFNVRVVQKWRREQQSEAAA